MFSVPDVLVVSILALLLFGPDRLPKVMRQAGRFIRECRTPRTPSSPRWSAPPIPTSRRRAGTVTRAPAGDRKTCALNVEVLAQFGDSLRDHRANLPVQALLLLFGQAPVDHVAGGREQSTQNPHEENLAGFARVVVARTPLPEGTLITVAGVRRTRPRRLGRASCESYQTS